MDAKWVATIISCVLFYVIYVPIMLYMIKKIDSLSSHMVILKRHPTVVIRTMIFAIFYVGLSRFFALIPLTMLSTGEHCFVDSCIIAKISYFYIATIFYSIGVIGGPLHYVLKYWIILYDIKWIQATFNCEWKSLINPNFRDINSMRQATPVPLSTPSAPQIQAHTPSHQTQETLDQKETEKLKEITTVINLKHGNVSINNNNNNINNNSNNNSINNGRHYKNVNSHSTTHDGICDIQIIEVLM